MKSYSVLFCSVVVCILAAVIAVPSGVFGQSLTSGDVTGTVTDPSGAAVAGATVTLKNNDTGQTQTATSSSTGAYRFALLNPGSYTVSVEAQGFKTSNRSVTVAVGQVSSLNIALTVATASQTVEVTAQAGVIQTDNGNVS